MIKLAFLVTKLQPQGPIKQIVYQCTNLNRNKVKPFIITLESRFNDNALVEQLINSNVELINFDNKSFFQFLNSTRKVQNVIDKFGIDILQSFGFRSDILASKLRDVIKVNTIRNTHLVNWRFTRGYLLGSLFGYLHLNRIRKFDYVLSCSNAVKEYMKQFNVESTAILNAIDYLKIRNVYSKYDIKSLRIKLSLPQDSRLFLTVSSKLRGKNIEFLISYFEKMSSEVDYLIVTGANSHIDLSGYNCRNIIFTGQVSNLDEYMAASDFFISASEHEGLPNAVLEAMALGKPVILSNIPSHMEIIEKSKRTVGVLFSNNSFKSLNEALTEIYNYSHDELSSNCSEFIQEEFDVKQMILKYEDFYTTILTQDGSSKILRS